MRSVKWSLTWSVVAALILVAAPASAQVDEKSLNVNFGGGYTLTANGDSRDKIGDGYHIVVGATLNPTRKIGFQVEYSFTGLGQKRVQLPVYVIPAASGVDTDFYADANFHYLNFNAVLRPMGGSGSKASPYFIAGGGYYFRSVDLTTPGVGYVPGFCSPWWYVCYPGGLVPVEYVVGSRGSNDFGLDFGAGLDFKFGGSAVYIEARYHYILGPELVDFNGKSYGKANGQFLPITFGLRF